MPTPPRARRFPAVLLVAVALLTTVSPLSAAERARHRIPGVVSIHGWTDVRGLVSVLFGALGKSGSSLDPNGSPAPGTGGAGTTQAPADGRSGIESGSSLDPDGSK